MMPFVQLNVQAKILVHCFWSGTQGVPLTMEF